MRHRFIVGICLLSCFLLSSTAFISSVQANEVKEAVEEKQESIMNSLISEITNLDIKDLIHIFLKAIKLIINSILVIGLVLIIAYIALFIEWAIFAFIIVSMDFPYTPPPLIYRIIFAVYYGFFFANLCFFGFIHQLITDPMQVYKNFKKWLRQTCEDIISFILSFLQDLPKHIDDFINFIKNLIIGTFCYLYELFFDMIWLPFQLIYDMITLIVKILNWLGIDIDMEDIGVDENRLQTQLDNTKNTEITKLFLYNPKSDLILVDL